jgi:hypothetical protein
MTKEKMKTPEELKEKIKEECSSRSFSKDHSHNKWSLLDSTDESWKMLDFASSKNKRFASCIVDYRCLATGYKIDGRDYRMVLYLYDLLDNQEFKEIDSSDMCSLFRGYSKIASPKKEVQVYCADFVAGSLTTRAITNYSKGRDVTSFSHGSQDSLSMKSILDVSDEGKVKYKTADGLEHILE